MYTHVYVCIHIYMYTYIYIYMYIITCLSALLVYYRRLRKKHSSGEDNLWQCTYTYTYTCIYIYIYMHMCFYYIYIYIHVIHICISIYIYIYIMCQLDNCQIRGWRAVSAAASLGKGSSTRSVLSQTPVSLLLACTLSSYIAIDHYWSWHVFVIITVYHCARPLNQVLPSHRSIYLRCAHDTN